MKTSENNNLETRIFSNKVHSNNLKSILRYIMNSNFKRSISLFELEY